MNINSSKKNKTKTIGLVLTLPPKYSETFFINKIKGLQENDFEVILFVEKKTKEFNNYIGSIVTAPDFNQNSLKRYFLSIYILLKALFFTPKASWRLYTLDRLDGFSIKQCLKRLVINQHFLNSELEWLHFGFGMLAVGHENIAKAMGAKMGVSFRGFDLYLSPLKHPNCYKLLFQKQVKYHVLSATMKNTLKKCGVKEKNIEIIPPAIDVKFFKPVLKTKSSIVKFITIGRLHWKKGIEYTLEALAILNTQKIEFHYTIIGEGDQLERLKFAAHQLGISDKVTFSGKKPHKMVRNYLQEADIYIQYSVQEGFCNAVLEAQSMGLMCVVSNADGLDENILDKKTGWVVEKRKPNLLAKKLKEIIDLPDSSKNEIKKNAIERVHKQFNLSQQQLSFLQFYKA